MRIMIPAIDAVVLTAETRRPVPGATVQVRYRVSKQDSRVVPPPALTDAAGRFRLDFNLADIVNPNWPGPAPTQPDTQVPPRPVVVVTFEVTLRGTRLAADGRIDDLLPQDQKVTLLVDESALAYTDSGGTEVFVVTGRVRDTSGFTLPPLEVRAFDRDLRHEELLGSTRTDTKGSYTITYQQDQFRRAEKAAADLVIRVFVPDDKEAKELAASPIHFNAPARHKIDIELSIAAIYGVSEYELHLLVLTPLLEKVGLDQLTDDDLRFLLGETDIPWDQLDALRLDAKWSREHKLPAAACYGLLREGLPADLPRLLNEKPSRWRAALKSAIERRLIPLALADQLESILQTLSGLAVDVAFQPPAPDA
uniref:carboxypeptidase-like regulatory domain-containing protein n=1 Tax=Thiocapsa sp. TaxID=2024551 RepID=UPI003593184F